MTDKPLHQLVFGGLIDQQRAQRNALPSRWDERLIEIAPRGLGPAHLTFWLAEADMWDHLYQQGPGYGASR